MKYHLLSIQFYLYNYLHTMPYFVHVASVTLFTTIAQHLTLFDMHCWKLSTEYCDGSFKLYM